MWWIAFVSVVQVFASQAPAAASGKDLSLDEARVLACREADRAEFRFADGDCLDAFAKAMRVSDREYIFGATDSSGWCGLYVTVDRQLGYSRSYADCDE